MDQVFDMKQIREKFWAKRNKCLGLLWILIKHITGLIGMGSVDCKEMWSVYCDQLNMCTNGK